VARRARRGEAEYVIPIPLTHHTLGELAGVHRSTVTTLLNDWIYRDLLVARNPGWTIPDPDRLDAAAG
jgi:CRP-like cAMP-binding protein